MAEKKEAKKETPVEEISVPTVEYEEIFIIPESKGDTERYIAVNGERILVQTGKRVMVEKKFAEIIRNSQAQEAEAQAFIDAMLSK